LRDRERIMTRLSLKHRLKSGKPHREHPLRTANVGVVMILVGALGFYYAVTHKLPFQGQGGRLVTAYFTEANQLQPGNTPVRVDGIDIGKVASISPVDGGREGRVTLRITNSSITLHSDASASLQFRTLLGANFVVQLNPGSASAPPLANNTIPLKHTTVQVELDDILRIFNHHTSLVTRVDLKQLAASMAGTQARALITDAAPTLAPTPAAFGALRGLYTNDLSGLVASASQTMKTLSDDRTDLQSLISGGAATLSAVSAERPALASALHKAPPALNATVAVSESVERTLPPLNRLITTIGPGARALGPSAAATLPAARELRTTLDRVQPLLSEVHPAINSLSAAANPGDTVLTGLDPTLKRLNSNILPYLYSTDSEFKRPVYQLIGPTFAGFASVAAEYDDHSHIIHFPAQPELNSVDVLPCTVMVNAPTPAQLVQCSSINSVLSELLGGSSAASASTSLTSGDTK
jgi:phospholipid/cholesterol/gamma-HCH transport system substrate-binding protein